MKMRNKGKVHPTPSSSSPSSSSPSSSSSSSLSINNNKDALSILKLLPAAILALASVLSLEDKEVLAYMITRSIKATNPSSVLGEKAKKNNKKTGNNIAAHKPPMFDCECFDCYTSYWCKWDSSPNRELIHQAIEAFEEHLSTGEVSTKKGRNKKRDQKGRRGGEKVEESGLPENQESAQGSREGELGSSEMAEVASEDGGDGVMEVMGEESREIMMVAQPETQAAVRSAASGGGGHKGLARKVLPDVLGLFNSRLWSLWSPNV